MPHIIILDEFGNEIGREEHDPDTGGRVAGPDDDEATRVVMNIGKIIEARGIQTKGKPRLEEGE